jgi:hypothetical protein
MPKTLQPVAVTGPEVLDQDMTARDICDTSPTLGRRSCLRAMRPDESQPTSPSCPSY